MDLTSEPKFASAATFLPVRSQPSFGAIFNFVADYALRNFKAKASLRQHSS
jgi:hypothetical protein